MKSFQKYFYETNKVYEFRIKIANVDIDKDAQSRIRNALDAYKLESISAPKRLPIQEHRDFPKVGACECVLLDIALNYPTVAEQVRQLVIERCGINADCVCVYPKDQYDFNEEFEAHGKDHEGALLDETELKDDVGGQDVVGQVRVGSLLKELEKHTRQYEIAGKETTSGVMSSETTDTKSPVGSIQNKIPSPVKGK
jgi:hypothetical protein